MVSSVVGACGLLIVPAAAHGQSVEGRLPAVERRAANAPAGLAIVGDLPAPMSISVDELKAMPRRRVELDGEDGRKVVYEGVPVAEVLKRAGVALGRDLRGAALTTYVLATASDGYQVLFSLAELDPAMAPNETIVADTLDGKPLFAYQGPLRIVVPRDSRPARSIRMLSRLEVVRVKK